MFRFAVLKIYFSIIIILVFYNLTKCQTNGFSLDAISNRSLVAVQKYDSLDIGKGYGTGILLYNYTSDTSVYLLTANHVFDSAYKIELFIERGGNLFSIFKEPMCIFDSLRNSKLLTYTNNTNTVLDIVLLDIPIKLLKNNLTISGISKSWCLFSDSVTAGDHLLAFGFAKPDIFPFVKRGDPLLTSGIISYENDFLYLMDHINHKGMSGGIVFKEIPDTNKYVYRAIGVISSRINKAPDYTWIVKLDLIDSILVANTGKNWLGK
ncbi:MAG: hypothetical protein ABIJ12_08230 [bacterium]